jgi:hypothetical protein
MSFEFSKSAEFRDHIRNLLYEYSITHYTTNYIEYTEDLVWEVSIGPCSDLISID